MPAKAYCAKKQPIFRFLILKCNQCATQNKTPYEANYSLYTTTNKKIIFTKLITYFLVNSSTGVLLKFKHTMA